MARELTMALTSTLRDALWACYTYALTERHLPEDERLVCFSWAECIHRHEFGRSMHNGHLRQLARLGLLAKADTSRRGNRRYYQLTRLGLDVAQQLQLHDGRQ
jgi:hypothetical protein